MASAPGPSGQSSGTGLDAERTRFQQGGGDEGVTIQELNRIGSYRLFSKID